MDWFYWVEAIVGIVVVCFVAWVAIRANKSKNPGDHGAKFDGEALG